MSIDVTGQIDALTRKISEREHEGKLRRVVTATRTYATSPEDLWDAITRPERLARWFSTVTGDLRPGGRFKTTDSVSGTITRCDPPKTLAVTWEVWGDVGWVEVELTPTPDGSTSLEIEHILSRRLFDRLHWRRFGAGATGVGWELWLLGLGQHISTSSPFDLNGWSTSAEGKDFLKRSSDDWCRAEIASGESPVTANKRAARSFAFYSRGAGH
jgi:uncharacterized protein YndB with AHSA1/START domain